MNEYFSRKTPETALLGSRQQTHFSHSVRSSYSILTSVKHRGQVDTVCDLLSDRVRLYGERAHRVWSMSCAGTIRDSRSGSCSGPWDEEAHPHRGALTDRMEGSRVMCRHECRARATVKQRNTAPTGCRGSGGDAACSSTVTVRRIGTMFRSDVTVPGRLHDPAGDRDAWQGRFQRWSGTGGEGQVAGGGSGPREMPAIRRR